MELVTKEMTEPANAPRVIRVKGMLPQKPPVVVPGSRFAAMAITPISNVIEMKIKVIENVPNLVFGISYRFILISPLHGRKRIARCA